MTCHRLRESSVGGAKRPHAGFTQPRRILLGHLSNVSLWEFALGRRAVRIRAGPEEGVGAEPVVREGLDEEERLVDGVDRPADVVLALGEVPDEEALVRSSCEGATGKHMN